MLYNVSMTASDLSSYREPYAYLAECPNSYDATFMNFNDMLDKIMNDYIDRKSIKQEVLDMFGECIYFSDKEKESLREYIHSNSVEEKNNIFDYYD